MGFGKYLKVITVGDIVIALLLVLLTATSVWAFWIGGGEEGHEKVAVIELHGETVAQVTLPPEGETKTVEIPLKDVDYEAVVELERDRARVRRMPEDVCPLGICADTGWIAREGQAIVCVPNRLIIYLEGVDNEEDDLDGITG